MAPLRVRPWTRARLLAQAFVFLPHPLNPFALWSDQHIDEVPA